MCKHVLKVVASWATFMVILTAVWSVMYAYAQLDWTLLNLFWWPQDVREKYAVAVGTITVIWSAFGVSLSTLKL